MKVNIQLEKYFQFQISKIIIFRAVLGLQYFFANFIEFNAIALSIDTDAKIKLDKCVKTYVKNVCIRHRIIDSFLNAMWK